MVGHADLVAAVEAGDLEAVERILHVDPTLARRPNDDGVSLVLLALYRHRSDIATLLASQKAIDLHEAAGLGRVDLAATLLTHEGPCRLRAVIDGWTPLHLAAYFGHVAMVDLLLQAEANAEAALDMAPGTTNTALHAAAAGGCEDVVIRLLQADASPNHRDASSYTPLHVAAGTGNLAVLKALLAAGADTEARAQDNRFARDVALSQGHEDAALLLGADKTLLA